MVHDQILYGQHAGPHLQALHLLHDIRRAVEVVLLIVFVVGLLLGFSTDEPSGAGHRHTEIGRIIGGTQSRPQAIP